MKKCKYCQSEIDKKAKYCPNCQKKQGAPKWLSIVLIVIGIIVISSVFTENKEENAIEGNISNTTNEDNNSNTNANTNTTNDNQNQPVEKFTYEITNQYYDGYISYYIEGSVKNNKDKDYSYVQIEFICYDDEGNNLGTAIDNTNNLLGNQTWKYKAIGMFSGETVDHCEYHDITSW